MTVGFIVLFLVGVAVFVRGLMTVAKVRAAWEARSVPATASVIEFRRNPTSEGDELAIKVLYVDTHGQSHTALLPASQDFAVGDRIDVRFDPGHPATVFLSEHFAGRNLPIALIVFGGLLMAVSFAYVQR